MNEFKLIIDTLKAFTDTIYELPALNEAFETFGKVINSSSFHFLIKVLKLIKKFSFFCFRW